MHPNIIEFVRHVTSNGIDLEITTNAHFLSRQMSKALLKVGLTNICISMSGIYKTYEKIHRLDFETTMKNILNFLSFSQGQCDVKLSIVRCSVNQDSIDEIKHFWQSHKISKFAVYDSNNRGGSLEMDYYFNLNNRFYNKAKKILKENDLHTICLAPLLFNFIGWDGYYYLCCNEYGKKIPLGNVFTYGFDEMDTIKIDKLTTNPSVCRHCDIDVINRIREVLFKIEAKEISPTNLGQKLSEIKAMQETGTPLYPGAR
jgi:MoaA/NifB/PqqE/SkfB family radical SAM enzyme